MTKQKHNNTATLHTTKKITNWTQYSRALEQRGNFTVLLNKAVLGSHPEQTGKAGHPVEYADPVSGSPYNGHLVSTVETVQYN